MTDMADMANKADMADLADMANMHSALCTSIQCTTHHHVLPDWILSGYERYSR